MTDDERDAAFKEGIMEFPIDGGKMVIGDALAPHEGVTLVTGDGHFVVRIEAGRYGSVERIVVEREDA